MSHGESETARIYKSEPTDWKIVVRLYESELRNVDNEAAKVRKKIK